VSTKDVDFAQDKLLCSEWFLPLDSIDMKIDVSGKRCLVLLGLNLQGMEDQPVRAAFGGIVGIKEIGPERVEADEIVLNPSP
jgi:hypothetical protein